MSKNVGYAFRDWTQLGYSCSHQSRDTSSSLSL